VATPNVKWQSDGFARDGGSESNADLKTSLENADPKVKLAIANLRQVNFPSRTS